MTFIRADLTEKPHPSFFKRRFYIDFRDASLFVATNATDEEMEGRFAAWCLDENEWLWVNGWMIDDLVEEDGRDRDDSDAERRALGLTALD